MKFDYFQPTELLFGRGRIAELPGAVLRFGTRTLLVTTKGERQREQIASVKNLFTAAGVECAHFDGVLPNPTLEIIAAGARVARELEAQSIVGLGGGSSMDSAKAIAVEATHPGSCWDYLFYKTPPTARTLPIIAVSTTSGTGSQTTQVAVVTDPALRDKSALYDAHLYPRIAIVDPELMLSLPRPVTASTGFDAFCHSFESTLHPKSNPLVELYAWEAIRRVLESLPRVLADGQDIDARESMAWADTLAGYCIASAGVTLPHGIGMAIGGRYPWIAHGETLAIVYPAFARFTCAYAQPQFARLARMLDTTLSGVPDARAAEASCDLIDLFLRRIGLRWGLADKNVPEEELGDLARQSLVLPDYKANPRVPTAEEMNRLVRESYPAA